MHSSDSILERIVARARRLYTLPAIAAQVLELTAQEPVNPQALRDCIAHDAALAAKILRIANSSLFGFQTKVDTLQQAIALLGVRTLKVLVLGFSLPAELASEVPPHVLERFWKQSVYRAVAARRISQQLWQCSGDEAFLAAILSGVGRLALIQDLGQTYTAFLEHVDQHGGELIELELQVLGFDHLVLSARMLEHWGLPRTLTAAIARPRSISSLLDLPAADQPLAATLHLAERAADFLLAGNPERLQSLLDAATQLKNSTANEIKTLIAQLETEAALLGDLFLVPAPQAGEFQRLFSEAHARLAEFSESSITTGLECELSDVLQQATTLQRELGEAVCRSTAIVADKMAQRRGDAASKQRRAIATPRMESSLACRTASMIEICREQRTPLSLILVTIDSFSELVVESGAEFCQRLKKQLEKCCCGICPARDCVLPIGEAKFAVLLADHDRSAATRAARQLLTDVQRWVASNRTRAIKISLGVSSLPLPPRNFPEQELIEAARRCLHAAQHSGGNTVKSIEL